MAKEGSTVSGLMDSFATAVSLALQYGVPLKVLCDKFSHTRFEPSGWTHNPKIRFAKSVMDYIFRWLAYKFLPRDAQPQEDASVASLNGTETEKAAGLANQFTHAATESRSAILFPPSRFQRGYNRRFHGSLHFWRTFAVVVGPNSVRPSSAGPYKPALRLRRATGR